MAGMSVYVAKQPFFAHVDGNTVKVSVGDTVKAGHPLLKGREALFDKVETTFDVKASTTPHKPTTSTKPTTAHTRK